MNVWAVDHAPCTSAESTAWTCQKYVPFASPLITSCVTPIVELSRTTGENEAFGLTSQLYASRPLRVVTADQEIVNGSCTDAPAAGESSVGAAGPPGGGG